MKQFLVTHMRNRGINILNRDLLTLIYIGSRTDRGKRHIPGNKKINIRTIRPSTNIKNIVFSGSITFRIHISKA